MAAVREHLTDTSNKLRLAFVDLKAVDEEVASLTAGADGLPLSEAAARVLQGAKTAASAASKVLRAAELAEAAAGKAAVAVTVAREARVEAEKAAAAVAQAVAVAAQKAEAAALASAALEVKVHPPPVLDDHKWLQSGVGGISRGQGSGSSGGAIVDNFRATVAIKAMQGKRKLRHHGKSPRRRSARAAGSRQPNYAESPTREPSKRQKKASVPATGAGNDGRGARETPQKSSSAVALREGGTWKGCGYSGCITIPSFGMVGSKKREYCSKHAKQGMVNVKSKRCGHPGCTKRPNFGMVGSKKKEFCSKHAKQGMVNLNTIK